MNTGSGWQAANGSGGSFEYDKSVAHKLLGLNSFSSSLLSLFKKKKNNNNNRVSKLSAQTCLAILFCLLTLPFFFSFSYFLFSLFTATTDILTLEETATYLRTTEDEILELLEARELKGRKLKSGWRIHKKNIKSFFD